MQIRKLNSLRALAALIVFVTHFSDVTNWLDGSLGGRAGQYGVMLFFLLSGFLMAHLYLVKPFNTQAVQGYWQARIARVVPLYMVVVLLSFGLSTLGEELLYAIPDLQSLLAHLLLLDGESVLWTVPVEMQFYLLFPLLWALVHWRPGYLYVLVAVVLVALFLTNYPRIHGDLAGVPYNFFNLVRALPYFLVGVLLGLNYRRLIVPDYLRSHWFLLPLLLIPLMYPALSPVITDARMKMWLSFEVLFVMTAVFFSVVFLVPDRNGLMANALGDYLGKISYSLYLLHLPVIRLVVEIPMAVEFQLLASLLSSVALAHISYQFLERPLANLIRRSQVSGGRVARSHLAAD